MSHKNKIIVVILFFLYSGKANAFTVQGNLTVTGNAFSVGTSTLTCSNGNVGIGTTNPKALLHVSGTNPRLEISDPAVGTTTEGLQLSYNGGVNSWSILQEPVYSDLMFAWAGSTVAIIDNNGRVGIANNGVPPSNTFQVGTSSFVVTSGGNVGIGTTSPHDSLEIAAPALSGLRLTGGGLNHGIDFYYTGGTTYPSYIQVNEANSSAGWMRFGVDTGSGSSAEIMRLQANGNVGIGTTSPSQTLSVNGTVSLNTNSGTQIYRCSGGTDAGWILYGNSGAAQTLCTGGGGSLVATGVFLP
ncbi:MAG: hypothetical protein KGL39_20020 [Patescibacteria group bacterium]|nr:hypothetical protein [Patescibacteria group bacterium]